MESRIGPHLWNDRCRFDSLKHVNRDSFDIFPYITALTLDIITQCAFGQDIKVRTRATVNWKAPYLERVLIARIGTDIR